MGIIGDAAEKLGKTVFDIGVDVQQKITKADAVDFTYENTANFHKNTNEFINRVSSKTNADGSLTKGDFLDDGTVIDSENPNEMIQRFQDKQISETSKRAKTGLQKDMFESSVRSSATGNVLHSQSKQFKENIEYRVKKLDDNGNIFAAKASTLGAGPTILSDGSTSAGKLISDMADYKNYVDAQGPNGVVSPAIAEKMVKSYGAVAQDNYHSGLINQFYSGAIGSDIEKIKLLNMGKTAIKLGIDNNTIEPAMAQKYASNIAAAEVGLFKANQSNLKNRLDEAGVSWLTSGKVDQDEKRFLMSDILKYAKDDTDRSRLQKNLLQDAHVAGVMNNLAGISPSKRGAAIDEALNNVDALSAELAAANPNIKAGSKAFEGVNREELRVLAKKQSAALVKEMSADPAAYDFKVNASKFVTDVEIINNQNSSPQQKQMAMDHIIKTTEENQATVLETAVKDRRILPKEMIKKLSNDMMESAKSTTLSNSDMFNDAFLNNYSQAAIFKILDQSVKDGVGAHGKEGFDPLYKSIYHFPNRDSMNRVANLVAQKAPLKESWGAMKDSAKKMNLLEGELATSTSKFYKGMRNSKLTGTDLSLQNSFNQVGKLYMMKKILEGSSGEEAGESWKSEIEQNFKVVDNDNVSFIFPANLPEAPIREWADNFTKKENIKKYLQDVGSKLPANIKDYDEYASTIVNSDGGFGGNSTLTGVWLKYKPSPDSPTLAYVLGANGRPLEITFDSILKKGTRAVPLTPVLPDSPKEANPKEATPIKNEMDAPKGDPNYVSPAVLAAIRRTESEMPRFQRRGSKK